ncbi:MAG: RecX family transcriptional regulator [Clostridia bacterium]|nr:RecX family transcriptional regulator [Clostridia bacterium]
MAKIIYIKESKTKGYLVIGVKDGEEKTPLTVNGAAYAALGSPSMGEELDPDTLEALTKENQRFLALRKALYLLSFSDNSERNLRYKLMRAGYPGDVVDFAVSEVLRLGYINEARQLERLILTEANSRLFGPMKIISRLVGKGYSPSDVRAAIEALRDSGEVDFDTNRARLLEKLPDGYTDEDMYKLLYKYGYKTY